MAVARDTETRFPATDDTTSTATGDQTFSHAGSASAGGATVMVLCTGTTAVVTGVLYGGVAMTLTQSATDTSEAGRVELYTLTDSGFPTGTQTVTLQGCTATAKWATCATVTVAAGKIATVNQSGKVDTTTSTNPTVTLVTTDTTMLYGAFHSGLAAPPAAGLNYTGIHLRDYGQLSSITIRRNSPPAAGSIAVDTSGASDDWCGAAVAFAEADPPASGGTTFPPLSRRVMHLLRR